MDCKYGWSLFDHCAFVPDLNVCYTCIYHIEFFSSLFTEVDHPAFYKGAAIVNPHLDCSSVGEIFNRNLCTERKGAMSSGLFSLLEDFSVRCLPAFELVGVIRCFALLYNFMSAGSKNHCEGDTTYSKQHASNLTLVVCTIYKSGLI